MGAPGAGGLRTRYALAPPLVGYNGMGWNESCPAMGAAPHMQIVNATAIVLLV